MIWSRRLDRAEKVNHFTKDDEEEALCTLTCVVGEISASVHQNLTFYEPYLEDLGKQFYDAVKHDRVKEAKVIHAQIHRSALKAVTQALNNPLF